VLSPTTAMITTTASPNSFPFNSTGQSRWQRLWLFL
jgi:hypothetical protein